MPEDAAVPASSALKRTPFHDLHVALGGRMVDFAGWEMPLAYGSILEEHKHCRESGAFFDVSHMGRLKFEGGGGDVEAFLNTVITRDVSIMKPGQSRYGFVTNAEGGIKDDIIVAKWGGGGGGGGGADGFSMVVNASNREKLLAHFNAVIAERGFDCRIIDRTLDTAMAAFQGPKVFEELGPLLADQLEEDPQSLKRFGCTRGEVMGSPVEIYRSGYTGEDGIELVCTADMAKMIAGMLGDKLKAGPIYACGLGARDTLRIEAALPLYGHELSETIDPISTGMGWAVNKDGQYLGGDIIRAVVESGPKKMLVGLELDGKRTARQGTTVMLNDLQVGEVTSGCMSPTLGKSVAMAYVAADFAGIGTTLGIDFKREVVQATVVPLPFYKRA